MGSKWPQQDLKVLLGPLTPGQDRARTGLGQGPSELYLAGQQTRFWRIHILKVDLIFRDRAKVKMNDVLP